VRVVCVNNERCAGALTVGKQYEADEDEDSPGLVMLTEMGFTIILENDLGKRESYQSFRFKPIEGG